MSNIQNYLEQILTAIYGKDVRQSIHDAISQCYDDVSSPTLNSNVIAKVISGMIDNGTLKKIDGDGENMTFAIWDALHEMHKKGLIRFWVGTKAEYNAITPEDNVFYIITDEDPLEAIEKKAEQNASDISSLTTTVNSLKNITGSTLSTTTTDITVNRTNSTGNTTETATWYLHKFDDGVLEAWANVTVLKVDCNTAVGSGYSLDGWYRSGLQTVNVAFPSDFSSIDFVGVQNPFMYFADSMSKYQHITALNSSKSAAVTVYSSTSSNGTPVVFGLKLTGRWK
jgi:hypothetical protein